LIFTTIIIFFDGAKRLEGKDNVKKLAIYFC